MRRSTAAAVGTLTGAALILGVRLSVQPVAAPDAAPAAQEVVDEPVADETTEPAEPEDSSSSSAEDADAEDADAEDAGDDEAAADDTGLANGTYKGKAVQNPYGTVQVTIKVSGGKISAADATYPKSGYSATINPNAVKTLAQETLSKQSADVDAVSGATFTSQSYVTSLQAALDKAGA
ncbi:FMN-binding protein [Actinoplanes sp. NPDC051851]|uniref:FMN-binding protein n=1 Tax=Actinoplanes sp. NPDC051851 TaxID=3154753 RepID=UPI003446DFB8